MFKISSNSNSCITNNTNNKSLLWYSNKVSNYSDILINGFTEISNNIPVTGTNFGRGHYFYDIIDKALSNKINKKNIAIVLLCEVDLGKQYISSFKKPFIENEIELRNYSDDEKLDLNNEESKPRYNSVLGYGQNTTCDINYTDISIENINYDKDSINILTNNNKIKVPLGIVKEKSNLTTFLPFNEYVVYNPNYINPKYLLLINTK